MRLGAAYANVHVMRTRRLVQWGMFSMVSNYLDGIRSVLDAAKAGALAFDFFINLNPKPKPNPKPNPSPSPNPNPSPSLTLTLTLTLT